MSKIKGFRRKNKTKMSEGDHFAPFSQKNRCIYRKMTNVDQFFIEKKCVPTNFMSTEICQKVENVDLRTALSNPLGHSRQIYWSV